MAHITIEDAHSQRARNVQTTLERRHSGVKMTSLYVVWTLRVRCASSSNH